MRFLRRMLALGLVLYLGAWAYRIVTRKYYIWLPGYVSWLLHSDKPATGPVHILMMFVDHFEPGEDAAMMDRWGLEYPKIADRHRDSTGRVWQHTWFYPGEQPIDRNMRALQKLVGSGYGETELHLHHSNDTEQSAKERFRKAVDWFQTYGFLKGEDGASHFGFIHGNWSLDNSRGNAFCGNNRELAMLRELGCFADYTFSSIFEDSQPASVNNIYEATEDAGPKSYNHGVLLQVGVKPVGDLTIFQGPLLLVPTTRPRKLFFEVENAEIHAAVPVTPRRVDAWVRANIHVEGRPEWRFIKIHTHGGTVKDDADEILGKEMDDALTYLERNYNDGTKYVLHYVTAREAFNVARAATDGKDGNPARYYEYLIPRYVANRGEK
ncbi:MAG: hypothetical protein ABI806_08560 [Candidatus Solibacter sp.]